VKRTGDGILIEFRSVVDAVRCAIEVQKGMVERNAGLPPERRIEFRVGIHLGDVVEESDGDLMGDGVNIAARLEGIADRGGICISRQVLDQVEGKVDLTYRELGRQNLTRTSPSRSKSTQSISRLRHPRAPGSLPRSRNPLESRRAPMTQPFSKSAADKSRGD
jgi:adenylate cyclase